MFPGALLVILEVLTAVATFLLDSKEDPGIISTGLYQRIRELRTQLQVQFCPPGRNQHFSLLAHKNAFNVLFYQDGMGVIFKIFVTRRHRH